MYLNKETLWHLSYSANILSTALLAFKLSRTKIPGEDRTDSVENTRYCYWWCGLKKPGSPYKMRSTRNSYSKKVAFWHKDNLKWKKSEGHRRNLLKCWQQINLPMVKGTLTCWGKCVKIEIVYFSWWLGVNVRK